MMEQRTDVQRLLTAQELWSHQTKHGGVDHLIQSSRSKYTEPDDSMVQQERLNRARREYGDILDVERIEKLGSLCIGSYSEEKNQIKLVKMKGRVWSSFGHGDSGDVFLYPEEALFLMESGILRVLHNALPASIQQAYGWIDKDAQLTFQHYFVYAHLCRLGFVIQRHNRNPKNEDVHENHTEMTSQKRTITETYEDDYPSLPASSVFGSRDHGNTENFSKSQEDSSGSKFDFDAIPFFTQKHSPTRSSSVRLDSFSTHSLMDYRTTKETSTAQNWSQFKEQHQKRLSRLRTESSSDALAPTGSDVSLPVILSKLQLSSQQTFSSISNSGGFTHEYVVFDVYGSEHKKSNSSVPIFQVIVKRVTDDVPSLLQVSGDSVGTNNPPLYYALCDGADVSFYSISEENVPLNSRRTKGGRSHSKRMKQ